MRAAEIAIESQYLVRSAEPAVVFSSLAHLSVAAFSDSCTVDIIEDGAIAYRIARYRRDLARTQPPTGIVSGWSVSTPFAYAPTGQHDAGYIGVMTHRWHLRRPSVADRDRAAVLARQGVAAVAEERHLGGPQPAQDAVDHLDPARADSISAAALRRLGCRGFPNRAGRAATA